MRRNSPARKVYIIMATVLLLLSITSNAAAQPVTIQAEALNIRTGPGTGYSILTTLPRGIILNAVSQQGGWFNVVLPDGGKGWAAAEYTAAYSPPRYATVTATALNVRSGPGTDYGVVSVLDKNTSVPVIEMTGDWLRIILPAGRQGWIHSRYANTVSFGGYVTVTASALNLRGGPGTGDAVMEALPRHTILAVLQNQGDWLLVSSPNGKTGWVAGAYTAKWDSSSFGRVPSGSGAASAGLAGRTIVIDPGHGGPDPGAIGVTGLYEKLVNFSVAQELATLLQGAGANVIMTRYSDWNPSLWQRSNLANTSGADVLVSIHANAHTWSGATGTETYYYPYGASSALSYRLACNLQQNLVWTLGLRDLGVKTAGFYVLANSYVPAALVELGFLTNYYDESLLKSPEMRRYAARAIYNGLVEYFK